MQAEICTTSPKGGQDISPVLIAGAGSKHFAVETLHSFKVFHIKHRVA